MQRSPLGGRNFECFSEDPYLSASMAVAYITGVQSEGVGASVKHYICNDQEFERYSISAEVRERVLREIYLPPFQAAVQQAKAWTVMAAYNAVNGIAATEHAYLLTNILRNEWGFDGVVISDWYDAVKSTAASVNAGLDLEMPNARWRGERLLCAVEQGEVSETTLDTSARRLLSLEFAKAEAIPMAAVRLGCLPPVPADALERAVALAASSDFAIVCVGFGGQWQSEGFDRPDMELPGKQNTLIERVAAVNAQTIVVLNAGSPNTMPWLDQVAAVVQAWYPGQECGNAIADVLFGDVNPSGKLPQTFPVRLSDNPAYLNFPGENGKIYYGEGLFIGYRYYDTKQIAPLFPFGFGLSYTTFSYSAPRLSTSQMNPDDTLQVSVDITNSGQCAGKEVVQMYIRDEQARLQRPEKELKGFAKVFLEPGERKTVTISIGRDALAYFDDLTHEWVAEARTFKVLVGASSRDIRSTAPFVFTATSRWRS